MRLGLVTCSRYDLPGPEDELLLEPLAERGVTGIPIAWDAPGEEELDALLVRSVWNYWHHPEQFLGWLQRQEACGRQVLNGLPTLRWNLRKRYLCELGDRGVDIVPTILVEKAGSVDLGKLIAERGWPKIVVKPMIGGDAHRVIFADARGAPRAQRILDKLAERGGALVQPLMPAIREGERSLVFFNHEFSHALHKIPKDGDYRVQEHFGSRTAKAHTSKELRCWAADVLEHSAKLTGERLVYARVDAVITADRPQLMELEAIDPHLWLSEQPGSENQFATAIATRLIQGSAGED